MVANCRSGNLLEWILRGRIPCGALPWAYRAGHGPLYTHHNGARLGDTLPHPPDTPPQLINPLKAFRAARHRLRRREGKMGERRKEKGKKKVG